MLCSSDICQVYTVSQKCLVYHLITKEGKMVNFKLVKRNKKERNKTDEMLNIAVSLEQRTNLHPQQENKL